MDPIFVCVHAEHACVTAHIEHVETLKFQSDYHLQTQIIIEIPKSLHVPIKSRLNGSIEVYLWLVRL